MQLGTPLHAQLAILAPHAAALAPLIVHGAAVSRWVAPHPEPQGRGTDATVARDLWHRIR